jgi:hypothetical protein
VVIFFHLEKLIIFVWWTRIKFSVNSEFLINEIRSYLSSKSLKFSVINLVQYVNW